MKRQLLDQRKSCYIYKQIFDIYLCLYRYTKRAQKPSRLTVNTKNTQSFSIYNTIYVATISSDFRYLHRVSETVFQNIKLVQNTYEIDQIILSEKKSYFFFCIMFAENSFRFTFELNATVHIIMLMQIK